MVREQSLGSQMGFRVHVCMNKCVSTCSRYYSYCVSIQEINMQVNLTSFQALDTKTRVGVCACMGGVAECLSMCACVLPTPLSLTNGRHAADEV